MLRAPAPTAATLLPVDTLSSRRAGRVPQLPLVSPSGVRPLRFGRNRGIGVLFLRCAVDGLLRAMDVSGGCSSLSPVPLSLLAAALDARRLLRLSQLQETGLSLWWT